MNSAPDSYPWHAAPAAAVRAALSADRIPHAWLFSGPSGLGKHAFALRVAAALLCDAPDGEAQACGACRGCRLREAGHHPDFLDIRLLLKGEVLAGKPLRQDATGIRIDQVREMSAALALSAHSSRYKVALVDPADLLVPAAANALLKTLEEPTAGTVIILVASRPWRLPATVRSRCQLLPFPVPEHEQAAQWLRGRGAGPDEAAALLAVVDGRPLRALELVGSDAVATRDRVFVQFHDLLLGSADPLAVAAAWAKEGPLVRFDWAAAWLVDVVRLASAGAGARIDNPQLRDRLQALAQRIDLVSIYGNLDRLREARRLLDSQANTQLLCEDLLLGWSAG